MTIIPKASFWNRVAGPELAEAAPHHAETLGAIRVCMAGRTLAAAHAERIGAAEVLRAVAIGRACVCNTVVGRITILPDAAICIVCAAGATHGNSRFAETQGRGRRYADGIVAAAHTVRIARALARHRLTEATPGGATRLDADGIQDTLAFLAARPRQPGQRATGERPVDRRSDVGTMLTIGTQPSSNRL